MARAREIKNFLKKCVKVLDKIEKMEEEKPEKFREELDEMAKSVIAQWYASYDPNRYRYQDDGKRSSYRGYRRQRSLYQGYRIYRDGVDLELMFDSDFIYEYVHNQDNEIVYNNTFVQGYHGGSKGTDKNKIEAKTPDWRAPYPSFTQWYHTKKDKLTTKSVPITQPSPYEAILKESEKMMQDYIDDWANDLKQKVVRPLMRSYNSVGRR